MGQKMAKHHGMSKLCTYRVWADMKKRCSNENCPSYERYGKRGIFVCERWKNFENFIADMGERPDGLTLERIDNNGPYSPENCRWATPKEQAGNKRNNVYLELHGKKQLLEAWADELGVNPCMLRRRQLSGWSDERAITTPSRIQGRISGPVFLELNGEKRSAVEWACILGISYKTIMYRHKAGWSDEKILTREIRSGLRG